MFSAYVLQIEWGDGFTSPFIGPFSTETEAKKAIRPIQAKLRSAGRKWRGRVKVYTVVDLDCALYWAGQDA